MSGVVIVSAILINIGAPTGRLGGVTAPIRAGASATARFIFSGGVCVYFACTSAESSSNNLISALVKGPLTSGSKTTSKSSTL